MSEFTLDTGGVVMLAIAPHGHAARWPDLSPFEQGYIEALFASHSAPSGDHCRACRFAGISHCSDPTRPDEHGGCGQRVLWAFSDLAPGTLEAIRKDCGDARKMLMCNDGDGAWFWAHRRTGQSAAFPPVLFSLGDDGRVYLKEGV